MSDELTERLRALDPERGGTDAPPIERLLARLDERQPSRAHRSRRRPIAVAVALACLAAVALAAIVLGGSGDPRRDALTPAGDGRVIVHVVSRTSYLRRGRWTGVVVRGRGRRPVGTLDGPSERWSAVAPQRWRSISTLLPGKGMPGATTEQAFAGGVIRTRQSGEKTVRTMRPPDRIDVAVPVGMLFAAPHGPDRLLLAGVADPRAAVHGLIETGDLRAAGATTRDGRRLLRFLGESQPEQSANGGIRPVVRATYLLDAETYAPVEARTAMALPRHGSRGGPLGRFHPSELIVFDTYENLPLNAKTAPLLRLGGPAG